MTAPPPCASVGGGGGGGASAAHRLRVAWRCRGLVCVAGEPFLITPGGALGLRFLRVLGTLAVPWVLTVVS